MKRFQKEDIRERYDDFAGWYDLYEGLLEIFGVRKLRRRIISNAWGEVLETAVGTGKNLPHYPRDCRITGVDISPGMLDVARERADSLDMDVDFRLMDVENLDFPDRRFDTVVDSLSLCTFPNPVLALKEMARVCCPDGTILLLEHGKSSSGLIGRLQDWRAEIHAETLCCYWNRKPLEIAEKAGLQVVRCRRTFFGIFHEIEAKPACTGTV